MVFWQKIFLQRTWLLNKFGLSMLFYYHIRELLFEYLVFFHVMLRVFVLLLWCRSRTWLFLSYVIAFVSLAGSAGMLVQDALLPDTPSSWTGVAGVLQCTCVLARYTHLSLFFFPFCKEVLDCSKACAGMTTRLESTKSRSTGPGTSLLLSQETPSCPLWTRGYV